MIILRLTFYETVFQSNCFPKQLYHFALPQAMYECSSFYTFSPTLSICHLFYYSHFSECVVVSLCVCVLLVALWRYGYDPISWTCLKYIICCFDICIQQWKNYHNQDNEDIHHQQTFHFVLPALPSLLHAQETTDLLSVTAN